MTWGIEQFWYVLISMFSYIGEVKDSMITCLYDLDVKK
jgi:hypothetical protein